MLTEYTVKLADRVLAMLDVGDPDQDVNRHMVRSLARRVKDAAAEMSIEQMQNEIIAEGYVFQEQTFPNGDSILKFKKTDAFNPYDGPTLLSSNGWTLGWGRFQRRHAWLQAHAWIVLGGHP